MSSKTRQTRAERIRRWVRFDNPVTWWLTINLGSEWDRRRFFFLSVGWRRALHDGTRYESKSEYNHHLIEPERAVRCRRTILATSASVIAAFVNDVDPDILEIAGVSPDGLTGTLTVSLALILGQAYCWFVRYSEIAEDGEWESFNEGGQRVTEKLWYARGADVAPDGHTLSDRSDQERVGRQKTANWVSNRFALLGTLTTWGIALWWICKATGGA